MEVEIGNRIPPCPVAP